MVAVILFAGGVASNLVASDLEPIIGPYRRWVWVVFAIALVVAVAVAIVDARRRDHGPVANASTAETGRVINASREGNVAISGKIERSTIATGTKTGIANKADGDIVVRNKIIINQAASSAVNALHQLRAPVGDFVGRGREIETLINALRRGSHASINGMGGIGKTELALFVAEQLTGDYHDAQLFINLQGTDTNPRKTEEVLANCIRAFLGPEARLPECLDELSQLYRSQMSGKRVLLLLDNAADTAQVRLLLPPPGSVVLVTSRQSLTLPGMMPLTVNPLTDEEARKLLLEIAPHAEAAAEQICALCGCLPLAIRAAGSLLAVTADLDPVDYAEQLKDERQRLESIGKEGVEIGVAASFNLSYERLAPEAAHVFRLLSVFPTTFDSFAEEVVGADAGHAQLSDLLRRSLVLYDSTIKRYRLHNLARLFANTKLSGEEHILGRKRHATHYKAVLSVSTDLYEEGGEALARGLALFDLEWSNIQAGHDSVTPNGVEVDEDMAQLGKTYPTAGVYVLHLRLHAREWIRWLEIALAAARRLKDREYEGIAVGSLGLAYVELAETQRAIQFDEQYLNISRQRRDRRGEATALNNLGIAYGRLNKTKQAIRFYQKALLIDREIGDRRGEGNALGNLGNVYAQLGKTKQAIQFYEKALSIDREIGDRRGEGADLCNLGVAYYNLGETERAIPFYKHALLIHHDLGDRIGKGHTMWNMSLALDRLGQRAQAIEYAEQSLTIHEQIEDPYAPKVRAQLATWREGANLN